ncbi:capsular associated protein [Plectosphaerella plurivora]|uniref:Capsular associated protein n=1 Tax=Plectosphaerella plurivora TaxID=936078 RepID=A0A9P9A8I3_9PEZI|nr:capsular associated protein [Plectosphaerella plurivora]
MAQDDWRSHLTAVCAVVSFLWISHNFESHTLSEWPRFSVVIILLLSSGFTWIISNFASWLPGGSDGRFDEGSVILNTKEASHTLARRPRRYFVPVIIACLVLRIEAFHQTTSQLQCSKPGIESFLCTILVFYDVFFGRKQASIVSTEPEDPWTGITDDIQNWLKQAPVTLAISVALITSGTYLAVDQKTPSTYFCSTVVDNRSWVLSMQLLGLVLDAVIAILLWRVLAWTKATKSRLRTLAMLQGTTAFAVWIIYLLLQMQLLGNLGEPLQAQGILSLGWLYIFDMINDSFTVAVLIISTSLLISDTGPLKPFGVATFATGAISSYYNIAGLGTWHASAKMVALGPLHLVLIGFALFMYTANIRSILFIRRVFLLLILVAVLIGMSIYTLLTPQTINKHPIKDFIIQSGIDADRWLRQAAVSDSLRVAVDEYRVRNNGREPPPNFDKWYDFAKSRNSVIIDHFQQIRDDVAPFWQIPPADLRQLPSKVLAQESDIAFIRIIGTQVSHSYKGNDDFHKTLDRLVEMIQNFNEHLVDMELPINLSDEPRSLASWSTVHHGTSSVRPKDLHIITKRGELPGTDATKDDDPRGDDLRKSVDDPTAEVGRFPASSFQEMEAQSCPAGSSGRTARYWNVRDFCFSCVLRHSKGLFLRKWGYALNRCNQPDVSRLHGFHMSSKEHVPFSDLLPVFSRHKVTGFNDMLIPWPQTSDEGSDNKLEFKARVDRLHWRGRLGDAQLSNDDLHGHQAHRLLHLVNNATTSDEVVMLVPTSADDKKPEYAYQRISAPEANAMLPFDLGVSSYGSCETAACLAARLDLGQVSMDGDASEPLMHRYVLLLDSDSGPNPSFMQTLRSLSVPMVSSIFRTWYTERVMAWVHFVPLDVRYHGLHSTLAYFVGLKGAAGRFPAQGADLDGHMDDAAWIGWQGAKWVDKALRPADEEVYLFRLLLEWGRIISDDREHLAFDFEAAKLEADKLAEATKEGLKPAEAEVKTTKPERIDAEAAEPAEAKVDGA